ncbi:MAG TPA: SUMF1/EgtB/PvdO family nonheme iron enzyme [Pirellulales bacterium]|nr:SUMF1/EgtB/PvdO family nonheme iron enzyme [Pirellulales bacterium]
MQARVACPACQTVLAVDAAYGDGARFSCPQCGHEFAVRLRRQNPPAAARPANDPLASPYAGAALHPSYRQPVARRPAASRSMLWVVWVAVGGGAVFGVGCVALMLAVMNRQPPADNLRNGAQDAGQNVALGSGAAGSPAGAAPVAPATSQPSVAPSVAAAPGNFAPAPSVPPSAPPPNTAASIPTVATGVSPMGSAPTGQQLAYRFNSGEEYAYSFSVKADIAGTQNNASGMTTLKFSNEAPPPDFAAQIKQGKGSGSGFIVASDGYIVTCAHVVEESTNIEVVVGAQTYPGQIVAFDREHDLAVVRITAANLPTVSLANSDAVQLGQEVRAVGFPLSNVLGESVKITRGTIAGVVNTSGRKLFQVDASINPGNSGGPLVNELGQVVGVASAKLTGEDIDGVGFAVPASEVLTLLRSKGISPAAGGSAQQLSGTELARIVTPAVAMIKVTTGPAGFGAANRLVLDYSGNVTTSGPPRVVGRMRLPGFPNHESDRGKLLLSERGELLNMTGNGNVQLPYLLGPLGTFPLEPLGAGEQRNWQVQHATTLTQISSEESNSPFSLRFRHRSRSPFGQNQTKVVVTPAMETNSYELTGISGDLATIIKRYTFQTLDPAGAQPVARMNGEGTITFNRAKGCAEKMTFRATLVRTVSSVTVTIPLTMEWRRLSKEELEKMQAEAKASSDKAKKAHEERMAREAKADIGEDTEFVGGDGGSRNGNRYVDETSLLYGVECRFAQWMGEDCVSDIVPVFSRDRERKLPAGAMAREGYAVGAVNVNALEYVNGIQLIYMRVKDDGRLDSKDSYTSEWLGVRARGRRKPHKLTGDGDPIIGIHLQKGLVVAALALVVNREAEGNPFAPAENASPPASKKSAASTKKKAASNRDAPKPAAQQAARTITNSLGMKLALIPVGAFSMGSDEAQDQLERAFATSDDPDVTILGDLPMPSSFDPPGFPEFAKPKGYAAEHPAHRVKITKPFHLGAFEVTKGQFRKFVEAAGYKTDAEKDGKGGWDWVQEAETLVQKPEYNWRTWEPDEGEDHPVVNVTWNDATAFCAWLSAKEGKKYRLPSEAEWEYACGAGGDARFHGGDDEAALLKIGNVRGFRLELVSETKQKNFTHTRLAPKPKDGYIFTAPVGRFRPNRFGLYDMTGNVSEWCADRFDDQYYAKSPAVDPQGPAGGASRVLRGGGWDSAPIRSRSAFRSGAKPDARFGSIGFRVALSAE